MHVEDENTVAEEIARDPVNAIGEAALNATIVARSLEMIYQAADLVPDAARELTGAAAKALLRLAERLTIVVGMVQHRGNALKVEAEAELWRWLAEQGETRLEDVVGRMKNEGDSFFQAVTYFREGPGR